MKRKIPLSEIINSFETKINFKKPLNIATENLFLENFDELIGVIESINWKKFAASHPNIFPAVGTMVPRVFKLHHISYQLLKRGYPEASQAHLRTIFDIHDLVHLFFQKPDWGNKWYKNDEITSAKGELSPAKVRNLIGKKQKAEPFISYFSKFIHPTSANSHGNLYAAVEEENELRAARLDTDAVFAKIHLNIGGEFGEEQNWLELTFMNILISRMLSMLDIYLHEYIASEDANAPYNCIKRLIPFLKNNAIPALNEISKDNLQTSLTVMGLIQGSMGDEITLKIINDDPRRISRYEKLIRESA